MAEPIILSRAVGGGYEKFWRWRGRYRVVKGSRASKKSKTAALWYISQLSKEKYKDANLLVVRRTYRSLHDSCFAELRWAVSRLGLEDCWTAKESPLEMVNRYTGQRIYFRGLDDPLKIASITVQTGVLCWLWVEEAYEIASEADFDALDETIRGKVDPPLFKQTTLTFNPWNGRHWLKSRFFDRQNRDVLALTTDYRCNEWLDDADRAMFARMKRENPRRYRVAGLGQWGESEGLVYENWSVCDFDRKALLCGEDGWKYRCVFGLDYGFTNDPTAFIAAAVNEESKTLYVFDEFTGRRMLNRDIAAEITRRGYAKERIRADSAEPKSNEELRRLGIFRLTPAEKGPDSVLHGIATLQGYTITVHPSCRETAAELAGYVWEKGPDGQPVNRPADRDNHLMDALRYAMADARRPGRGNPETVAGWRRNENGRLVYRSGAHEPADINDFAREMQGGWN